MLLPAKGNGEPQTGPKSKIRLYLNPEEPTFFKDLYKEIIIGNPKKVGSSGLR